MEIVGDNLLQWVKPSRNLNNKISDKTCKQEIDNLTHIAKLFRAVETKKDIWLVFEQGGETLHNLMFEIKGEFYNGSRKYKIIQRPFYTAMKDNVSILKVKCIVDNLLSNLN